MTEPIEVQVYQGAVFEFKHRWPRDNIEEWCYKNCKGGWQATWPLNSEYSLWLFENSNDAIMFKLIWS